MNLLGDDPRYEPDPRREEGTLETEVPHSASPPLDVGALYEAHGAFIGRSIERLTGPGPHADDLLQETFVAAFQVRDRYDPARGSARAWLYGIAANLCRQHLRGDGRFQHLRGRLAGEEVQAPLPRPDERLASAQALEVVARLMQELPLKQREVFVLFELEGLAGREIAELVGVSEGTVWTRLHHARKNFTRIARLRMATEGAPR